MLLHYYQKKKISPQVNKEAIEQKMPLVDKLLHGTTAIYK